VLSVPVKVLFLAFYQWEQLEHGQLTRNGDWFKEWSPRGMVTGLMVVTLEHSGNY